MRTLFVCTGNTCRSPMAERLAQQKYPAHQWESAGVIPVGTMHPMTELVLREYSADTDGFRSRDVAKLDLGGYDHLVLIGETAQNLTPDPPPQVDTHFWDVADPYDAIGSAEEIAAIYRACSVELLQRIASLIQHFG